MAAYHFLRIQKTFRIEQCGTVVKKERSMCVRLRIRWTTERQGPLYDCMIV